MRIQGRVRGGYELCVLSVCAFLALWSTAAAQDPIKAFPGNYSLVFENDAVAVIRVHYGPHEKVGVHDHSAYPTIYVYLNDSGPVRFAHFEEEAFTTVRPRAHGCVPGGACAS